MARPRLRAAHAPGCGSEATTVCSSGWLWAKPHNTAAVPSVEPLSTNISSWGGTVCAATDCSVRPTTEARLRTGIITERLCGLSAFMAVKVALKCVLGKCRLGYVGGNG